LKATTAFNS